MITWLLRLLRSRRYNPSVLSFARGALTANQVAGLQPPPPDTSRSSSRANQEAIEALYSRSKARRVIITRDGRGLFRLHEERWDTSDWEVAGAAYWLPCDSFAVITDTIENARKLAREALPGTEPSHEE